MKQKMENCQCSQANGGGEINTVQQSKKCLKVGIHEGTSPMKCLTVGTSRRDLSHEQFTQSFLRN